jgi:hypothetical protein
MEDYVWIFLFAKHRCVWAGHDPALWIPRAKQQPMPLRMRNSGVTRLIVGDMFGL